MAKRRPPWLALAALLIGLGAWQLGGAATIHAKAWLARGLLEASWAASLAGAERVKPWPWADTWPVARLQAPRLGVDRIVLAGTSGRTLAFGPGHMDGTAPPGAPGHSILSGHRDTHFRFLKDLEPGDTLRVQTPDGAWRAYRVSGAEVIDARAARLWPGDATPRLTLVTCFPFDAISPGGPLRYVVSAVGADLLDEGETTEAQRHGEPTRDSPRRHKDTKNTKKDFSAQSAQPKNVFLGALASSW